MKKNIIIIIILLSIILSINACNNSVANTNLTSVKVDDMQVGESISDVDFKKYTKSNRFVEKENTYNFEELKIKTDKNEVITQIYADIEDINLYINGIEEFNNIEDITNILGKDYKNNWYDREQKLKQNEYIDSENKIKAKFIYDDIGKNLVWIILNKYK